MASVAARVIEQEVVLAGGPYDGQVHDVPAGEDALRLERITIGEDGCRRHAVEEYRRTGSTGLHDLPAFEYAGEQPLTEAEHDRLMDELFRTANRFPSWVPRWFQEWYHRRFLRRFKRLTMKWLDEEIERRRRAEQEQKGTDV